MNSSEETCLLCLSTNKNMIKFYSETGKEFNVMSILSTHFWFQLDEIKVLSQNICRKCWKQTESFHEFYQSVRAVHKKFETVFVKIENDEDVAEIADDDGEILQHKTIADVKIENDLDIEDDPDIEDDEDDDQSMHEIPCANPIDTENRAFEVMSTQTQNKYQSSYDRFMVWKTGENIEKECFSEAVLLEYFHYLKSKYKPSSLWAVYSMLKTTIKRNDNVDISYPEILSLLKNSSVGYHSQTSNVFQPEELRRFLTEADDLKYLAIKVITIFMIYGANRSETLTKIKVSDVTEQGSAFVIKFPEPKTNIIRSFTLENEYAEYVKRYRELRPNNLQFSRFFLTYHNGKCRIQPIGKNKFSNAPKSIAKFLNLKDAENYSLLSFRKKSKRSERSHLNRIATETSTVDATLTGTTTANEIGKDVKGPAFDLLPKKSQEKYMRSYKNFSAWKIGVDVDEDCFTKEIIFDYFNHMKTKYKPASLWAEYSMLRASIQKHNNIDISDRELTASLKVNAVLFNSQYTSYVFQPNEMRRFLDQARDYDYLDLKVIMIFAMYGAGASTLTKVDVNDVIIHGSVVVLKLPERKTDDIRSYTLENEYATLVKKYINYRPESTPHNRFFVYYNNSKCTAQPMGVNKMLTAPKVIAKFLKLKNADNYTLNSIRTRSVKRKKPSSSVPHNFIEECIPDKKPIDDLIPVTRNKICEDTTAWELLPAKSKEKYIRSYENFFIWKTSKKIDKNCFSEEIVLEYFNSLKPKYRASSLWVEYSKLRTTIQKNDKIDIGYPKLKSLMRDISVGFESQKSIQFRPDEIRRFLSKADDNTFLAAKVTIIFGIYATIRSEDLTKVEVKDVTVEGSMTVIKVPCGKTKNVRSFTVEKEYTAYVEKYKKLRPKDTPHNRFFLNYQNGKCTTQPMGRNKMMSIPKLIAKYLNLQDVENYRWNSFSKTLSADDGGLGSSSVGDESTEESTSNNGQIDDVNSEQMCFEGSSEAAVTSAITNSIDTSTVETFQRAFQTYNFESHHIRPPYYYASQRQAVDAMRTSITVTSSTIPTAFESYHAQPHQVQHHAQPLQVQHYILEYDAANIAPNHGYGPR